MYKSTREGGTIGLDRKVCMKLETEGREEERERDQGVIRTPKHVSCSLAPLVGSRHTKKLYRLFQLSTFPKTAAAQQAGMQHFFRAGGVVLCQPCFDPRGTRGVSVVACFRS